MNTPVLETEDGPIAGMTRKEFLRGIAALGIAALGMGLALSGLGLTGVFAQEEVPQAGGVLAFNLTASPSNFDPMSNGSSTTLGIISPCYNSLVRFDSMDPNTVIGDLATSWELSEDGTTYTFSLPTNVLFHVISTASRPSSFPTRVQPGTICRTASSVSSCRYRARKPGNSPPAAM
jgi:ABC-type transport system substrate-binding protein